MRLPPIPLAALLCLLASPLMAVDYYVNASTGNDSNIGTSKSAPWRTTGKVNSINFQDGDRIFFRGGQTFNGGLTFDQNDTATATNKITLGSYDGGRAIINNTTYNILHVHNRGGFVVENLIFEGSYDALNKTGAWYPGSGIYFSNTLGGATKLDSVLIQNVEVRKVKGWGIYIGGEPSDNSKSGYKNVQIINSESHDNGDGGIGILGKFSSSATAYAHENVSVVNCKTYNNRGYSRTDTHSGHGILISDVDGGLVERCVAYNNGEFSTWTVGGPVGIWAWDANAVTIQYCESYGNKSAGSTPDGGGFDLDGGVTNSIMQYNYSHDNQGAGYLLYQYSGARPRFHGNIVRYNISQNDGRKGGYSGIYIGGGPTVKNNQIYNNTVFISKPAHTSPAAFKSTGVSTGNVVRNNLFVTSGGTHLIDVNPTTSANLLLQGNNYWSGTGLFSLKWGSSTYSSIAAWQTDVTDQEKLNGVNVGKALDPMLTAPGAGGTLTSVTEFPDLPAYELQQGSPLVNAGLNLTALFGTSVGTRDYYGEVLPQGSGYDIGAHEQTLAWQASTIGTLQAAVSSSATATGFTMSGPGRIPGGTPQDAFQFIHQDVTGDFTITARVPYINGVAVECEASLMARSGFAVNAPFVLSGIRRHHGYVLSSRATAGAGATTFRVWGAFPPRWLRLQRVGNEFRGYDSADGVTWTLRQTQTHTLPATLQVGAALLSNSTSAVADTEFESIAISQP